MKIIAVLALAAVALAGCNAKIDSGSSVATDVVKITNIKGVETKISLHMTSYAMRAALGNNPNTAAYVTIENRGNQPDRLVFATCACAKSTSLHSMKMNGEVMEMAAMPQGFSIAPGEKLVLAPGGNHIMLEGLTSRPQDGSVETVYLTFEKAGKVMLALPVSNTPLAKAGVSDGHDHMKM